MVQDIKLAIKLRKLKLAELKKEEDALLRELEDVQDRRSSIEMRIERLEEDLNDA